MTYYVDAAKRDDAGAGTNWTTAKHTIQAAVDLATSRDTILVTDGVYAEGGAVADGSALTNRVCLKWGKLISVNGPGATVICGAGSAGDGAVRCAYVGSGATLSGFTLTGGCTRVDGDYTADQSGGGVWCDAGGEIDNCTIAGNTAAGDGGGAYGGRLQNCRLAGNAAVNGGGANSAELHNSLLTANLATEGGGAMYGTLNGCTLSRNIATDSGGGANNGTLNNCAIYGNTAQSYAGGAVWATLNNCTVAGNSAPYAGGAQGGTLNNCIVYFNTAADTPNVGWATLNYCCTTPDPGGTGDITADPGMSSLTHLGSGSPCIGAGDSNYASGSDIDGEPWAPTPAIGCDEFYPDAAAGLLTLSISQTYAVVTAGFPVSFTAWIDGMTTQSVWSFGDGSTQTNAPVTQHAWSALGTYPVVLTAYNAGFPDGVSVTVTVAVVTAPVHYVAAGNPGALAPYTSWATAAATIQDAVDAAVVPGASVLVTNGSYTAGGAIRPGCSLPNRVCVAKQVLVTSVNGPASTFICGAGPVGDGAVRCVYAGAGAVVSGFTLTGGCTRADGDYVGDMSGGGAWCDVGGALSNCVIVGNAAGACGGGVDGNGVLYDCAIANNAAADNGGGASGCTLWRCALTGNATTLSGGGASGAKLHNCIVERNTAVNEYGGGAYECTVSNSFLAFNTAGEGGGAQDGRLYNCTVTANTATQTGGGVGGMPYVYNSIVYFNTAPLYPNYSGGPTFLFCCTTPAPSGGMGNLASDPGLCCLSHLGAGAPCIGAGSATYASGTDIDGDAWGTPPCIGCDEYASASATGPLAVTISADYATVTPGFLTTISGWVEGAATQSVWRFDDDTTQTNKVVVQRAWSHTGLFPVVLTACNAMNSTGVTATVWIHVIAPPVHYASAGNPSAALPYTSWATAAATLQDAVNAATVPGAIVLATNGVYDAGGAVAPGSILTSRVCLAKMVSVRSVGGPAVTTIRGAGPVGLAAARCAYVGGSASLSGFTLANGFTTAQMDGEANGGGACLATGGVLSNCVLLGNTADDSGGGAYGGTLYACVLTNNSARWNGGGAESATLFNCLVTSNRAAYGGGASEADLWNSVMAGNAASASGGGANNGTLRNCLLVGNTADTGAGGSSVYLYNCTVVANAATTAKGGVDNDDYHMIDNSIVFFNTSPSGIDNGNGLFITSCTTPDPGNSFGNITDEPQFMNAAAGDFRLQASSPCINAGDNSMAPGASDLGGLPRIEGGEVDMGAYEYFANLPTFTLTGIPFTWLVLHGLPTDGSADNQDPDHDGMTTFEEWVAGTDPTNAASGLKLTGLSAPAGAGGMVIQWQSVDARTYAVSRSSNLVGAVWSVLATNLPATPPLNTYTDTTAVARPSAFYRITVAAP